MTEGSQRGSRGLISESVRTRSAAEIVVRGVNHDRGLGESSHTYAQALVLARAVERFGRFPRPGGELSPTQVVQDLILFRHRHRAPLLIGVQLLRPSLCTDFRCLQQECQIFKADGISTLNFDIRRRCR
jgi:hypothetical protein